MIATRNSVNNGSANFGVVGRLSVAAAKFRSRKRGNVIISDSLLPSPVMEVLLQIMALPNNDEAKASAARVLGKCNCFQKLVPLFMTWMKKRMESIIPAKTAANLEFPEMEMVGVLSILFPIEKLLDWTNSIEEDEQLEKRCTEILDCLVVGGKNISHMLRCATKAICIYNSEQKTNKHFCYFFCVFDAVTNASVRLGVSWARS